MHTHDLGALLQRLEDSGQPVDEFWELVEFTIYGVQYRYDAIQEGDDPLDRALVLKRVEYLYEHVAAELNQAGLY